MSRVSFLLDVLTIPAFLLGSFGCAGERPPAEGGGSPSETSQSASTLFPSDTDRDDATTRIKVCDPGASRECTYYYVDQRGQTHCLKQTQYCRADSFGWLSCGERAEESLPETPDEGSQPAADPSAGADDVDPVH